MTQDLSERHGPVSSLFPLPRTAGEWTRHRLSEAQVRSFREKGYVAGIRVLDDAQVDVLRDELAGLVDPSHPGNPLFYEYNTNEAKDPSRVLFHALGAWSVSPA